MARVTSNAHCNCNFFFPTDGTLSDLCVRLPQVRPSSEHSSVRAVFLFLSALQMQQPGVTRVRFSKSRKLTRVAPALLRMQLPPIKPPPTPVYHPCSFVPPPGKGKFCMSANSPLCLCQYLTLQFLASAPRQKVLLEFSCLM